MKLAAMLVQCRSTVSSKMRLIHRGAFIPKILQCQAVEVSDLEFFCFSTLSCGDSAEHKISTLITISVRIATDLLRIKYFSVV